jgi:general secretion pathway protein A
MFESHFGFSGPPFQLSPDPSFYFDSKGHANVLSYLKFGVYQGEGFIVVTGEVGAGKTTLVRALLSQLNGQQVVAAQVVSTQLEAGDLLRSITAAFGVPPAGRSKADLILTLESFLTSVAAANRRALLIVDEAQNLSLEAIEELRMLSNFQLGNRALLQSFLVGQPELRSMLESPSMEQFRQRVIASCHLGPLDPGETRAYIEHRLRVVGWTDVPSFDPEAFDEIHTCCGGVPRRINQLCNRLLLAAFLGATTQISRAEVRRIWREMQVEVGDHPTARRLPVAARPRPSRTAHQWVHDEQQVASISTDTGIVQVTNQRSLNVDRPLLCIASSAASFAAIGVLARTIAQHPELPQVVAVNPGDAQTVAFSEAGLADKVCAAVEVHLGAMAGADSVTRMTEFAPRLEALIRDTVPRALLTIDADEPALVASLLARGHGVPVLRLHGGVRNETSAKATPWPALIDRVADVVYTDGKSHVDALAFEGLRGDHIVPVGSLTGNLLRALQPHLPPAASVLARQGIARVAPGRFVLVVAQYRGSDEGAERHELIALVSALARRAPTIWLVTEASMTALLAHGLYGRAQSEGAVLLPTAGYLESLAILNGAGCIVRGYDERLIDEADALGVPAVMLRTGAGDKAGAPPGVAIARNADQALVAVEAILGFDPAGSLGRPPLDDTAGRIVQHLRGWFTARIPRDVRTLTEAVTPP